jgi:hypothetical protein
VYRFLDGRICAPRFLGELRKIYGNAVVPAKHEKNERQQAGFDFAIRVHEAASRFDSPKVVVP